MNRLISRATLSMTLGLIVIFLVFLVVISKGLKSIKQEEIEMYKEMGRREAIGDLRDE